MQLYLFNADCMFPGSEPRSHHLLMINTDELEEYRNKTHHEKWTIIQA